MFVWVQIIYSLDHHYIQITNMSAYQINTLKKEKEKRKKEKIKTNMNETECHHFILELKRKPYERVTSISYSVVLQHR